VSSDGDYGCGREDKQHQFFAHEKSI
jgi:hypothetical protein